MINVKLVPVNPDEIDNYRQARRGRVSYPLLKMFLESGLPVAKLDRTGMQNSLQSLNSCLGSYIRSHKLPIRIFQRQGELHLARTDVDDEGNILGGTDMDEIERKANQQGAAVQIDKDAATPITGAEVLQRYEEERGQVTK